MHWHMSTLGKESTVNARITKGFLPVAAYARATRSPRRLAWQNVSIGRKHTGTGTPARWSA
jgi:hypothetical protein